MKAGECDVLEFVAHADRGIEVGGVEGVAVGQAVVHGAVHRAGVNVEVLVEEVVGVERVGLQAAAANAERVGGATGLFAAAVSTLMNTVIGGREIQMRNDTVAGTGPVELQVLSDAVGSVADDREDIAADIGESGAQ